MSATFEFNLFVFLLFLTALFLAAMVVLSILLFRRIKDLNQSRENLKLTIEATTDLVVLLDREGRYVDVFSSDEAQMFRSRESLIGKPVSDVIGESIGRQTLEVLKTVFATGEPGFLSYSLAIAGGTRWYEANVFKRDEAVAVVAIRDITKLKSIETDASRLRDRLRFTLSSAGIGVWEWDLETGRGNWDESMYRLYGALPGDLKLDFDEWREMILPADRERAIAETLNGLDLEGRIDTRFRVYTRAGKLEHLRSVGELVRDSTGKPVRILGVTWSITREASLAEEFERQKQFTANILDSIGDPVFMKDRSHRWTYGNQAFARILGLPLSKFLGKTDHDVFPKEVADKFWESDEITYQTMSDYELEEKIVLPEGGERILLTKKTPLILPDGSKTLVGIIRDITERRQMERQLEDQRTRQVAASRLASLGEMAGGMAHEINNPLAIISGYASRVRDLVSSLPTAKLDSDELKAHARAIEIANRIEATTLRIATIIKGLRAISRDGSRDEMELVNAKSIIEETLELCIEQFRNEGITLECEIHDELPVNCRRVQISQVLLNLLTNSFFAVSNQERKLIRILAKRTNDMVELAVEDSGPGVPVEMREKIFQPFFTTKPVGKGTGLGLSIASSLVRDHGGEIVLDETAPYTRFVMRLPLCETSQVQ